MSSLKIIPSVNPQNAGCADAEAAMEEAMSVEVFVADSRKATCTEDNKGPSIEPAVTDKLIEEGNENSDILRETNESRIEMSEGHEDGQMKFNEDNKNAHVQYQCKEKPDQVILGDSTHLECEESVLPYEPNSINHSILARFIATPFNARSMNFLHAHKDDKEWDAILPVMNLPILSQKRCIQLLRQNANKKISAGIKSPWHALSNHNMPQHILPPQSFMINPQFQQRNPDGEFAASISSDNMFPLQFSSQNSTNQISQSTYAAPTTTHTHSLPATTIPNFSQMPSIFTHPQFHPPGFNNGYWNKLQQYQTAQILQAQNASLNATVSTAASVPQVTASKPLVINQSSIQSVAKLPVAFGFHIDNEQSRILAQAAAQKWSQQGMSAMQASAKLKAKSGKIKTPHKSSTATPNTSPRMSPVPVPTPGHKIKGLPEGWTAKTYKRVGGTSVGSTDTYFYSPVNKIKFRSKNKIALFIEILREVEGDEKRAFELFKERGHRV